MADVTPIKHEILPAESELEKYIEALNQEYALVLRGSQVLIMRYWLGEEGISRLTFLSINDFYTLLANHQIKMGDKYVPISKLWIKSKNRAQFEDVYFRPCDKKYKTRYNLWRGFAVIPKSGCKHDLFLKHIEENICQGNIELYNWLIDWMADLIQKPHRKPGTAIVLRGEMGTGKGQFAKHIGKLFGQHFIPILHGSQLTNRFNSHLADKVFVFVDESGWSHDKHGAGIIRGMITESHLAIEMKGKDIITMENYGHFVIAANSEWVVPASMHDERRFAVFTMGEAHRNDTAYFKAITEQMENGGYETLLYFLQNHQYDDSTIRTIPHTDALMEQKLRSMQDEAAWWHECLVYAKIGDYPLLDDNSNYLKCHELYNNYRTWCDKLKRIPLTDNTLPKNLKKMINLQRRRKSINGEQEWFYFLPALSVMRSDFDKHLGHKINWLEGEQ